MAKEKTCGIYLITSPTGSLYVGQSTNCETRRQLYKNHRAKGQFRLHNSILKYGWENHTFEIIHKCSEQWLDFSEMFYIRLYDTFNTEHGMNLQDGGNKYRKSSEETRRKQSAALKGKNTWTKGRKHSEETKRKISQNNLGKFMSEESKMKVSQSNKGRKLNEEQKQRISKGHLGIPPWNKGLKGAYKHTPETLKIMSEKSKGRKKTEEQLQRQKETCKKRWSDPNERQKMREILLEYNRKKREQKNTKND